MDLQELILCAWRRLLVLTSFSRPKQPKRPKCRWARLTWVEMSNRMLNHFLNRMLNHMLNRMFNRFQYPPGYSTLAFMLSCISKAALQLSVELDHVGPRGRHHRLPLSFEASSVSSWCTAWCSRCAFSSALSTSKCGSRIMECSRFSPVADASGSARHCQRFQSPHALRQSMATITHTWSANLILFSHSFIY